MQFQQGMPQGKALEGFGQLQRAEWFRVRDNHLILKKIDAGAGGYPAGLGDCNVFPMGAEFQ